LLLLGWEFPAMQGSAVQQSGGLKKWGMSQSCAMAVGMATPASNALAQGPGGFSPGPAGATGSTATGTEKQ